MLLSAENSFLLLVDMQEKLIKLVHDYQKIITNCRWLINLAKEMNITILASEHYPQGLGPTVQSIRELLPQDSFIEKVGFSCLVDSNGQHRLASLDKEQVIIMGIEAHVCVLQTAVDLLNQNKKVFVVAEGVGSRSPDDARFALDRMHQLGIQIITKEMVLFEWLRTAAHPRFKELSNKFLK